MVTPSVLLLARRCWIQRPTTTLLGLPRTSTAAGAVLNRAGGWCTSCVSGNPLLGLAFSTSGEGGGGGGGDRRDGRSNNNRRFDRSPGGSGGPPGGSSLGDRRPGGGGIHPPRREGGAMGGGGGRSLGRVENSPSGLKQRRSGKGNSNTSKDNDRAKSFEERFLRPAARGELAQKHSSGIPKLAARKGKARLVPPDPAASASRLMASESPLDEDDVTGWASEADDDDDDDDDDEVGLPPNMFRSLSSPGSQSVPTTVMSTSAYYDMSLIDDSKYYWREEDYEKLLPDRFRLTDEELYNEDGLFEIEVGDDGKTSGRAGRVVAGIGPEDGGDDEDSDFDDDKEGVDDDDMAMEEAYQGSSDGGKPRRFQDPDEDFFLNQNDIFQLATMSEDQFKNQEQEPNLVMPLQQHGPELDDFLEAVMEHPSKYAEIVSIRPHSESTREPKPRFPPGRLQPPAEFVEAHARFLYVAGLPPLEVDGETGDLSNPIHRGFLQRTVAGLVNVDSSAVFPASPSSAFVGLPSPVALARALAAGPTEPVIVSPPALNLWRGPVPEHFEGKGGTIVELKGIPPGNTAQTLLRSLFPKGSEVEKVYGNVTADDVTFRSATSVLIRFKSQEQAESAVSSSLVEDRLNHLGRYVPQFFRARRELVHAGYHGPNRSVERRTMGPRLLVDGDMPTKSFYLSHAGVLHLRNLDPSLPVSEVSAAFDQYCARRRDVVGSIEIVTCHAGLPTGDAYVGFDIAGEAEAAVRDLDGYLRLGAKRATVRLVKDRRIPGQPAIRVEKRGERTADELLDELNNWEKFVDPEQLKILERAGIAKVALDEALRGIRYNNKTFGSFDSTPRSDALEPQKSRGELYKGVVQLYISTLIECLPTEDNVGVMYEATHFPDEPIDLSIFQTEKQRQKKLLEKRANA